MFDLKELFLRQKPRRSTLLGESLTESTASSIDELISHLVPSVAYKKMKSVEARQSLSEYVQGKTKKEQEYRLGILNHKISETKLSLGEKEKKLTQEKAELKQTKKKLRVEKLVYRVRMGKTSWTIIVVAFFFAISLSLLGILNLESTLGATPEYFGDDKLWKRVIVAGSIPAGSIGLKMFAKILSEQWIKFYLMLLFIVFILLTPPFFLVWGAKNNHIKIKDFFGDPKKVEQPANEDWTW